MSILDLKYHEKEEKKTMIYIILKNISEKLESEYRRYNRAQADALDYKVKNSIGDPNKSLKVLSCKDSKEKSEYYFKRLNTILELIDCKTTEEYEVTIKKFVDILKDEVISSILNKKKLNQLSFEIILNNPNYHITLNSKNEHWKIHEQLDNQVKMITEAYELGDFYNIEIMSIESLLNPESRELLSSLYNVELKTK